MQADLVQASVMLTTASLVAALAGAVAALAASRTPRLAALVALATTVGVALLGVFSFLRAGSASVIAIAMPVSLRAWEGTLPIGAPTFSFQFAGDRAAAGTFVLLATLVGGTQWLAIARARSHAAAWSAAAVTGALTCVLLGGLGLAAAAISMSALGCGLATAGIAFVLLSTDVPPSTRTTAVQQPTRRSTARVPVETASTRRVTHSSTMTSPAQPQTHGRRTRRIQLQPECAPAHAVGVTLAAGLAALLIAAVMIADVAGSDDLRAARQLASTREWSPFHMSVTGLLAAMTVAASAGVFPFHRWRVRAMESRPEVARLGLIALPVAGLIVALRLEFLFDVALSGSASTWLALFAGVTGLSCALGLPGRATLESVAGTAGVARAPLLLLGIYSSVGLVAAASGAAAAGISLTLLAGLTMMAISLATPRSIAHVGLVAGAICLLPIGVAPALVDCAAPILDAAQNRGATWWLVVALTGLATLIGLWRGARVALNQITRPPAEAAARPGSPRSAVVVAALAATVLVAGWPVDGGSALTAAVSSRSEVSGFALPALVLLAAVAAFSAWSVAMGPASRRGREVEPGSGRLELLGARFASADDALAARAAVYLEASASVSYWFDVEIVRWVGELVSRAHRGLADVAARVERLLLVQGPAALSSFLGRGVMRLARLHNGKLPSALFLSVLSTLLLVVVWQLVTMVSR